MVERPTDQIKDFFTHGSRKDEEGRRHGIALDQGGNAQIADML